MNRPYVAPRRVTLIGRNHFNPSHMTDMQRERADAPLQDVGNPIVLGAPMPAWCAGFFAGVAASLPVLYLLGAFS
jgi:hypothetical protein